jgi:hypothetical protein
MAATEMKATEIRQALAYGTGTSNYYKHWLGGGRFVYTDGARNMAEKCGAYWLLDIVFSCQTTAGIRNYRRTGGTFQVWKLVRTANYEKTGAWLVTCEDGNNTVLHRQKIPSSKFPLDEGVMLFVEKNGEQLVCCVASEH